MCLVLLLMMVFAFILIHTFWWVVWNVAIVVVPLMVGVLLLFHLLAWALKKV